MKPIQLARQQQAAAAKAKLQEATAYLRNNGGMAPSVLQRMENNSMNELAAAWPQMPNLDGVDLFAQYPITGQVDTLEDIFHLGIADRDLGLPSHSRDYSDRDERAAYVAGKCAAKRVLSMAEMLAELETLREAMDDEVFWRIGAW